MPKLYLKHLNLISMLLSLPETHTCKLMILVRMAAILFLCKFGIQTQTKLSGNDFYLFTLPKYDLKANF